MKRNSFAKYPKACICFALSYILSFNVTGCANDKDPALAAANSATETKAITETTPFSEDHLRISVSFGEGADYFSFTSEELGGNFSEGLGYRKMTDVTIEIDGQPMPLEDALRDGFVTEEEIFCAARLDARDGFCEESYESVNGLTNFTFAYPEYNLRLLYDVYEAPDGQQRLISNMVLYGQDEILLPSHVFHDKETGKLYDREDWGLDFEIAEISPTGLSIQCTQSGGQQIGQLETMYYAIWSDGQFQEQINESNESPSLKIAIQSEGVTELTIDWAGSYGQLPSGDYELLLYIQDVYDESQKHPLTNNFYDKQIYTLEFTVS